MVMSQVCDLRMRMNEKKKIGIEYEMAYVYNVYVSLHTLHDDFGALVGAELKTPSFMRGRKQLPAKEVEESRDLSSIRIHIERLIGLIKTRYHILEGQCQ